MPYLNLNQANYYYEETGSGNETIVFSHGLFLSGHMFYKQIDYFKDRHRIITYDHRGQGKTDVTPDSYDIDTLYDDAVMLIEKLVGKPVIFVGLSMGGFVGMRLAARKPALIKKLILLETSAEVELPETISLFERHINSIKVSGFASIIPDIVPGMFGEKFINDPARTNEKSYWINQFKLNSDEGIVRAIEAVIYRKGITDEIAKIKCPTLIMVGDQDVATKPVHSEKIHSLIRNSKLVVFEGGGHTSSVEEAEIYNKEIEAFLNH